MVNKKGIMRIVEASVAVLIILAILLLLASSKGREEEENLEGILPPILDEIAQNYNLRNEILAYDGSDDAVFGKLENFAKERIKNPALNCSATVCDFEENCFIDYPAQIEGDIFSAERVISTTTYAPSFEPKKVKIFLWKVGEAI